MPRTTKTPAKRNTYERRDPSKLKNHPLNITIYGDAPQGEEQKAEWERFLQSVKERGIDEPLLILPDNTIISGHRRNRAARILGLKEVPVLVRNDLADDLDAQEALITCNRETRTRTNYQKALEYEALLKIGDERVRRGRPTGSKKSGASCPTLTQASTDKGDTDESSRHRADRGRAVLSDHGRIRGVRPSEIGALAAEGFGDDANERRRFKSQKAGEIGWNRKKAEQARKVKEAIDEAKEKGQHEKAEELTQTLNQSVSRAYDKVKPKKKAGKRKAPKRVSRKEFNKYYGKLRRLFTEAAIAVGQKEGPHHRAAKQALETVLDEFRKMMKGRP